MKCEGHRRCVASANHCDHSDYGLITNTTKLKSESELTESRQTSKRQPIISNHTEAVHSPKVTACWN